MKKYKFRLQKLLDIRKEKEEESKIEFKKAQKEKLDLENKIHNLKNNYKKYNSIKNNESIIEQKIKMQYLNALVFTINDANKELEYKIQILDKKREELKQKQIERKTVEILKEKKKNEFIKEQNLIEQKANDEYALYGFIRKCERR
ncbi:flagellar biosynthesis chaperone [Clostridium acetireducens DSM 10703]|uniref:Flagellar FliJ protein n=1 Tax=Clostridium acetireducens DSM 10703 TaxID=1121290 RepID=A0A1E8F047_9CLOT|nr:flagellar export protein FliJ [Clostridium acetireducens]OFI06808.1 flagellar biosynthesis chaperone [Clostridium acetireducens DSM 10703]